MDLVQFFVDSGGDRLGCDLAAFVRTDEFGSCVGLLGEILDLVLRPLNTILFPGKIQQVSQTALEDGRNKQSSHRRTDNGDNSFIG